MPRTVALALLLALASGCAAAPPAAVSVDELRDRIAVLAGDDYAGRKPGTEGGAKTEAYIEQAFATAGLRPGEAGGGWRQPVALASDRPGPATLRLTGGIAVDPGEIVLTGVPAASLAAAPLVYAGNGDVVGADLPVGAVVLLDGGIRSAEGVGERIAAFGRAGAGAVIFVTAPKANWARAQATLVAGQTLLAGEVAAIAVHGWIARSAATTLVAAAGGDLAALAERAGKPGAVPVPLSGRIDLTAAGTRTMLTPANIIGKVAGSDPAAGAVMLTAHWDHLGLCRPEGAPDRICNGANDNASGVAMLIEVARRIAAGPRPVRDVYVVATTAEEMGLLGARAMAAAPPVPLDRIVAALNIDTAAIAPAGKAVAMIGRGRTPALDRVVDDTARRLGRRNDTDDEAGVMIDRQDGWALARRGVPSVMVSGSFSDMDLMKAYLAKTYHGPEDDPAHLPDLAGAAEDATLHVALVRALADPKTYTGPTRGPVEK